MKKLLCVFVYLIAFTAIMGGILTACADEPEEGTAKIVNELAEYSAINIDDNMQEAMGVKKDEKVIRVQERPLTLSFTQYNSIEEILKSGSEDETYYVIVQGTVITRIYEEEEIRYDLSDLKGRPGIVLAFLNHSIEEQLPQEATVLDVYFLWDGPSHGGCAIYYVTNKGDFVYYGSSITHAVTGTQQSLFTAGEFFEVMRTIRKYQMQLWGYADERKWLPIVIGTGIAVVAAGGAVGIVIYKKKKKPRKI